MPAHSATVRFIGLLHALRASAETALGDDTTPLRLARQQGLQGIKSAQRSLDLLEMLQEKTLGNLNEAERQELWEALRNVRFQLAAAQKHVAALEAGGIELPQADPSAT